MKTIPLYKTDLVAIVDDEDYESLSKYRWLLHKAGYAIRREKGKTILMHRCLIAVPAGMQVDHINHNGLDNRKNNLRPCTMAQNQRNRGVSKSNTSGCKGVYWNRKTNKWVAQIVSNQNEKTYLGSFLDIKDAARGYDEAAKKYHGEFAKLNFPRAKKLLEGKK